VSPPRKIESLGRRAVEQEVPFWPNLDEDFRDSNKLAVIRDLDRVAREVTRTGRPWSREGGLHDSAKVLKR
jgi:hypothetical protein